LLDQPTTTSPLPRSDRKRARAIRPLAQPDLPGLAALLRDRLGSQDSAGFASEVALAWKYLLPDGQDEGPRSVVLATDNRLIAHAGLCRTRLATPEGRGAMLGTVIDWAADPGVPGAGLALYRHAMGQADATFLIGGTPTTWAIAGALGFRTQLRARVYTRWLRPVREFLRRPKSARALLRLGYGITRHLGRASGTPTAWRAKPVPHFDEAIAPVLAWRPRGHAVAERTVAGLNHRLQCPTISTRAYVLRRSGDVMGYGVVAVGAWEARILELRCASERDRDWVAGCGALTAALALDPSVCRIRALASVPPVARSLAGNAYVVEDSYPVALHDPQHVASALIPADLQFFGSDLGYYDAA
jgi:hypothetical protein